MWNVHRTMLKRVSIWPLGGPEEKAQDSSDSRSEVSEDEGLLVVLRGPNPRRDLIKVNVVKLPAQRDPAVVQLPSGGSALSN